MSINTTIKCDFCGKEEKMDGTFPPNWSSASLTVQKLGINVARNMAFHICTICYEPEHSQKDLKKEGINYINLPSSGAKNILKKLLTFNK